jgi:alkanesulfonate monooxygenase SsuD/methylene tetrahydromethanopterin reductase-like flavin-dependent oxidoreductase (luciferase family)
VVPKPVQKPHPPVFQPFASSERTIRWCAEEGITPVLPPMHPKLEGRLVRLYAEVSGRPLGSGIGVLRDLVIADTDAAARAVWADGPRFCGAEWFAPFAFGKAMDDPDTGERYPDVLGAGLAFVGTVDTVTRQVEVMRERVPVDWVFLWNYNGLVDNDVICESMTAYQTEVVPRIADVSA